MTPFCFKCETSSHERSKFVRFGHYYRTSDSKLVQRFRCKNCSTTFTSDTFGWNYWRKERRKGALIEKMLVSTGSQRRTAKILGVNRKTVVRHFLRSSLLAEYELKANNWERAKAKVIEFDDLETFESSKCKPLSVTLAVEHKTRRILGLEVSKMPAKGMLVKPAKKYGFRKDERAIGRKALFTSLQTMVEADAEIRSDSNPHYPKDVKRYFPKATHKRFEGKRGSLGGQGELKKVKFDPLFSLNHTCAMFRANVNRLIRKTWCTTKNADYLRAHLILYANYHNRELIAS